MTVISSTAAGKIQRKGRRPGSGIVLDNEARVVYYSHLIAGWSSPVARAELDGLTQEDLNLLCEKTEGWVAALQIIRSSLSGPDARDMEAILSGLSGSQQFVFDYLAEEVFKRLPVSLQEFLLRTAILQHMDVPACNAVACVADAQSILKGLETQNLFLSSLDPQKQWYRYHFLFREFLMNRLQREHADWIQDLQCTAARHYEERGELETALSHYLSVPEYGPAARVLSVFAADYVERGRVDVLHRDEPHAQGAQILTPRQRALLQRRSRQK